MRKFLIVAGILFVIVFVKYQTGISNYAAEFVFLKLHRNTLAMKILDAEINKNYYTYYLYGRINFIDNNLYPSIKNFKQSIEFNPEFKEAYYGNALSLAYSGQDFWQEAIDNLETYNKLEGEEFKKTGIHSYGAWAGYNDLSWVYYLKGDYKNSEQAARTGLSISNNNPWLLNMLGISLLEQGECKGAIPLFRRALETLSDIPTKKFGESYSGDAASSWQGGKDKMMQMINDNIETCEREIGEK